MEPSAINEAKLELVLEYFQLGKIAIGLERDLREPRNSSDGDESRSVDALEQELSQVRKARGKMRNRVEELLEAEIDSIISSEGLHVGGPISYLGIHFPPVDS